MYSDKMKLAAKATSSVVVAMALMMSAAGLASAASSPGTRFAHHDVASSRFSNFDYARIGEGGLVTAVTTTSVTVNRWDGKITTYTITPTTTFTEGSSPTTAASLVVGDRINIRLARRAPTVALKINIELAELTGKVTSVVGNLITISGPQGFARAILVSAATTYREGGAAATLADVTVGAELFAQGTIDPNLTTLDALSVKIGSTNHAETYHGLVTAVTSTSATVNRLDGVTTVFAITPTTVFSQGANILTAASLVVGDHVNVRVNSGAPDTAVRIDIDLSALAGKVSAVSGNDITITTNKGFSRTIVVSATTTYVMGGAAATLADVTVGSDIVAVGLIDANLTSLDATKVTIRQAGHSVTYHGVVTAVTTTSLTVNRNDGTTTTFSITPSTVITEGSASMTVPSLAVGDTVDVTVNSAAPTTALRINIVVATLGGKVSAISGNDITITGGQGFARSIQVSATTTYTEGGAAATLADIVVGSNIVAVGTIDADKTTLDATSVTIKNSGHNETIHGLVTAVTTSSFTLNRSNGTTTTFAITSSTTFSEGSTVLSLANLVVGDSANVTVNSTQPTTAISVDILLATLAGHVTNVSGNTITITAGKGFARTIFVSATTTYTNGDGSAATLANVTVGSYISAQGTVDVDLTSLDATSVTIGK